MCSRLQFHECKVNAFLAQDQLLMCSWRCKTLCIGAEKGFGWQRSGVEVQLHGCFYLHSVSYGLAPASLKSGWNSGGFWPSRTSACVPEACGNSGESGWWIRSRIPATDACWTETLSIGHSLQLITHNQPVLVAGIQVISSSSSIAQLKSWVWLQISRNQTWKKAPLGLRIGDFDSELRVVPQRISLWQIRCGASADLVRTRGCQTKGEREKATFEEDTFSRGLNQIYRLLSWPSSFWDFPGRLSSKL